MIVVRGFIPSGNWSGSERWIVNKIYVNWAWAWFRLQCCQLVLNKNRLECLKKTAKSAIWDFKNRLKIGPIFSPNFLIFWPPWPFLLHFYVTIFFKVQSCEKNFLKLYKKISVILKSWDMQVLQLLCKVLAKFLHQNQSKIGKNGIILTKIRPKWVIFGV